MFTLKRRKHRVDGEGRAVFFSTPLTIVRNLFLAVICVVSVPKRGLSPMQMEASAIPLSKDLALSISVEWRALSLSPGVTHKAES